MAVVVEPIVTAEKLAALLAEQCEQSELDYKSTLNLAKGQAKDLIEFAKDVAAMQSNPDGGYIVVGADDKGQVIGLSAELAKHFDEATLRPKLEKYLTAPKIHCQVHDHDGKAVALVYIAPNPYGWCVIHTNGEYNEPGSGKPKIIFRHGDVFVRRGTSSERWTDADRERLLTQIIARRKDAWLKERIAETTAQAGLTRTVDNLTHVPVASLTWQLDHETFDELVTELLRRDDDIPLRRLLTRTGHDASQLLGADADELGRLLDRLTAFAALTIDYERTAWLQRATAAFERIYEVGFNEQGHDRSEMPVVRLWFDIITRMYALGALAVRKRSWSDVKLIADRRPEGEAFNYYGSWLRHAITTAAHANIFENEGKAGLLARAHNTIRDLQPLHSDRNADHPSILNSLCQFDVYSSLVVIGERGMVDSRNFYTNFSRYYAHRSTPAFETMVTDQPVRTALFDGDDRLLAHAIKALDHYAQAEGFRYNGWFGLQSKVVSSFLQDNPTPDFR